MKTKISKNTIVSNKDINKYIKEFKKLEHKGGLGQFFGQRIINFISLLSLCSFHKTEREICYEIIKNLLFEQVNCFNMNMHLND